MVQSKSESELSGTEVGVISAPAVPAPHPIGAAIDKLIGTARDCRFAAKQFVPAAHLARKNQFADVIKRLEGDTKLLEIAGPAELPAIQKRLQEAIAMTGRIHRSRVAERVEMGLFLALFSAFDAFTGELLRGLFVGKPELYASLAGSIPIGDVLAAESLDSLKSQVLEEEIESIRRKSYVEQFSSLSSKFGVELTKFPNWPRFVECSQRRNLLTHCDGIVSEQYLSVCRAHGNDRDLPKVGGQLELGAEYFLGSCELIIEVAVKLGQTLWRKVIPTQLEAADRHLMGALYAALENGQWRRARMIGEYGFGLKNVASEVSRRIVLINYAQALARDGESERAMTLIGGVDWSAASKDFKLACAVLRRDFVESAKWMRSIGVRGDFVNRTAYHTWPLFIELRESADFLAAYEAIYGHPYLEQLQADANRAQSDAAAAAATENGRPEVAASNSDAGPGEAGAAQAGT